MRNFLFPVLILSLFLAVAHATPLCSNNWAGGSCIGNSTITGTVTLTSDVNMSGNLTVTGTLIPNGHSILVGGYFNNLGSVVGGSANNGGAASGGSPNTEAGGAGTYGVYVQAYKITAGTVDMNGYNGGPAHGLGNGGNGGYAGGSTSPGNNAGGAGGGNGASVTPPTLSNQAIINMYSAGMVNYLAGAGGGTGGGSSGSNGGSYASSYGGSGGGGGASGCAPGTGNCNGGNGGGGGAGSAIFAYGAGGMTAGSYSYSGGAGGNGAGAGGGTGGSGSVTAYSYGSTAPIPTVNPPAPAVNSISPTSTFEVQSTPYTIKLTNALYPWVIKNATIYWGDGTSNIITTSSNSIAISHAYPYMSSPNPNVFSMSIVACDTDSACSTNPESITGITPNYPSVNAINPITPTTILEANSVTYTVNVVQGDFAIKNTTINWGDGNSNVIASSAVSVNFAHTYAYIADSKPDTFSASIVVCDVNKLCSSATPETITGIYISPTVTALSPTVVTELASVIYTVTSSKGNYTIKNVTVNWGDGSGLTVIPTSSSIVTTSHAYPYMSGNSYVFYATITVCDINGVCTSASKSVTANKPTYPTVNAITPATTVEDGSTTYTVTLNKGNFTLKNTSINWEDGSSNILISSATSVNFAHTYAYIADSKPDTFSPLITVCDINGLCSSSTKSILGTYTFPSANTISPKTAIEDASVAYTVNVIQGDFAVKNTIVNWGDGTSNILASSTLSVNMAHAYAYIAGAKPNAFNANIIVCDINNLCSTPLPESITGTYNLPSVNSINPSTVLEANSVTYTVNTVKGDFSIKNTIVNWGDATASNIVTSSSNSVNMAHTYAYIAGAKPNAFITTITVCDLNGICSSAQRTVNGIYTSPWINAVTVANAYSTFPSTFTFNIIQGNYPVTNLQIMWGDNSPNTFIGINTLTPSVTHVYQLHGNYPLSATAIDLNGAVNTLQVTEQTAPYISPYIGELSPQTVNSLTSTNYLFTIRQGTFTLNSFIINFGIGNVISNTAFNGINNAIFSYPINGNFSALGAVYDINGYHTSNLSLINVGPYPWVFTTPSPSFGFNVVNKTTSMFVQTSETDILSVNYSTQLQNIANDYICTASTSSSGLFAVSCVTNPNSFSYANQTLTVKIFATDTQGFTKSIIEQISLHTTAPVPQSPQLPFSNRQISPPLDSKPFQSVSVWSVIALLSMLVIAACIITYHYKNR